MATIVRFVKDGVFNDDDIIAMSTALDEVCKLLNLRDDNSAREVIASRIIDLAWTGERSPTRLRDWILHEADLARRVSFDEIREEAIDRNDDGKRQHQDSRSGHRLLRDDDRDTRSRVV